VNSGVAVGKGRAVAVGVGGVPDVGSGSGAPIVVLGMAVGTWVAIGSGDAEIATVGIGRTNGVAV
jgi:hypothetical protein